MRYQKPQIILLDMDVNIDQSGKILEDAEKMIDVLNQYDGTSPNEMISFSTLDNYFSGIETTPKEKIVFYKTSQQNKNDKKVLMLTHHEPDFHNQQYCYLDGRYFIDTVDDTCIFFSVAVLSLN